MTSRAGRAGRERGFTYVFVLIAVVVLAVGAQVALPMTSRQIQADREAELLFRGMAYQKAIASYYLAAEDAGRTVRTFPRRLEDLLQDPRFAHRRHLRRLYEQPMDERDWVLIRGPQGGIRGVASPSRLEPLKTSNFPLELAEFEHAASYRQWLFIHTPAAE